MNTNALKAEIVKNGLTYEQTAKKIGISETTFWRRMRAGNFGLDEANRLIKLLGIENPAEIFFGENQLNKLEIKERTE